VIQPFIVEGMPPDFFLARDFLAGEGFRRAGFFERAFFAMRFSFLC
jgi:hypothetical protein